jgi:hypothetical protein
MLGEILEEVRMKRTNILWIAALALGWFFDFLFWKHAPGINFAIYVVLCLVGGFLVLTWNGIRPNWRSLLLLVPILFFAAMSAIRMEPMSMFLAYAFSLTLLSILAVSYLGGRWLLYSLADYVANMFKLTGSMIARPFLFLGEQKKQVEEAEKASGTPRAAHTGWKRTWAVLRGLLIALPIVAILAGLLSSADLVFAARLDDFIQLFRLERLPEYIFRAIYILVGAYALAGVFLHAGFKSQDEKLVGADKPLVPAFLGFTEAAIVLGAVDLLFAVFVFIQFQYFFGGQTNIGVEGYTYAEYARRGFGELVGVAVISLLLFLGLSAIVKRQTTAQRWTFSGLGLLLVALVGVMLTSAFQRLVLYESVYGFTRLRTYTHVFMIWLGLLLAVVVVLDLLHKERAFALAMVLASIGFGVSLTLINVDAFIVRHNVARAVQGETLDAGYLSTLSSDSVPGLVASLQDGALKDETRDTLGAALICWSQANPAADPENWRSFTFSQLWAYKALEKANGLLDNYSLYDDTWPTYVETPLGETVECWSGGMD